MNKEKTQKNLDKYNEKLNNKLKLIKLLVDDLEVGTLSINSEYNYIRKSTSGSIKNDIVIIRKKLQELSNLIVSDWDYSTFRED